MDYYDLIKKYGLNEVKEQKDFLTNPDFITPVKPLVLAGGTGFGKTFTTILKLITFYSNPENKGKKTIILPSSTKVLRNNFGESMDIFNGLPFTYCVCTGKRDFNRAVKYSDCDVIIVLPQTLANIKELPKVEWLVVDEAHKWYFAKTIGEIITKTKPTYQLLLTGTPFKFNAKKDDYLMFYVPIEDMIDAGNVGNPLIEVVSSSINLKEDDFEPSSKEVRSNLSFSYKESDIDSTEFNKFKTEEGYRVLLVVDRGKEGFDMPELFNIVDFTLSTNPEIILQILGRVLRISKEQPNKQKIYYKVASQNTASFILTLMTGILQLVNREYYSTFTGKFDELKVPTMPREKPQLGPKRKNTNSFSTRALRYFQDVNIPLTADFWNQLSFKQGDVWKTMGQTTLKQVISEMAGKRGKFFITKDLCEKEAALYNTRGEFFRGNMSYYNTSLTNGWLEEFYPNEVNNRKGKDFYTYDVVKEEALKYKSRGDFSLSSNGRYYYWAWKNGWLDEWFSKEYSNKQTPEQVAAIIENNMDKINKISDLIEIQNRGFYRRYRDYLSQGLVKDYFNKGDKNFTLSKTL